MDTEASSILPFRTFRSSSSRFAWIHCVRCGWDHLHSPRTDLLILHIQGERTVLGQNAAASYLYRLVDALRASLATIIQILEARRVAWEALSTATGPTQTMGQAFFRPSGSAAWRYAWRTSKVQMSKLNNDLSASRSRTNCGWSFDVDWTISLWSFHGDLRLCIEPYVYFFIFGWIDGKNEAPPW